MEKTFVILIVVCTLLGIARSGAVRRALANLRAGGLALLIAIGSLLGLLRSHQYTLHCTLWSAGACPRFP